MALTVAVLVLQGMVEVSLARMKGKTAEQQRDAVIKGFPGVPAWFRWVPVDTATAWVALPNMLRDAAKSPCPTVCICCCVQDL